MPSMPVGRKPLPLFELVSDREGPARREAVPATPPAVRREPRPELPALEPKPLRAASSPASTGAEGSRWILPALGGKPLVIGTNLLWIVSALVLLGMVTLWVTGNANGARRAQQDFQRNFGQVVPQEKAVQVPADPLNAAPEQPVRQAVPPATPSKSPQGDKPGLAVGAALTPSGVGEDPRISGTNYLLLGTLGKDETVLAMQFFAKNGLDTFAVALPPVDRRGPKANTYPLFQLFASKGFASSEFGSRQAEREKLKQEVVRLGAIWKKDHKGSMSFSDAFWLKND